MITVRDLINIKGDSVYWVAPDTSTLEALRVMGEKNVGALLVMEEGRLVGIISERDFVRRITRNNGFQPQTPVCELMTEEVYTIPMDMSIDKCMQMMTQLHIRHLPVMEAGRVAGIISIGDVVKTVIIDQESTIQDLQNYITGRGYGR